MDNFKFSGLGEGLLVNCEDWVKIVDLCIGKFVCWEMNIMFQWVGSCWYYLCFIDLTNEDVFIDGSFEKYWLLVDLYVGGVEYVVLYLFYVWFWYKVLYDIGVVSMKELF